MSRFAKYLLVLGLVASPVLATTASAHDPRYDGPRHQHFQREGVRVTSVVRFSPAARAGMDRGDIILEVDSRDVNHSEQVHRMLHRTGQQAVLKVSRIRKSTGLSGVPHNPATSLQLRYGRVRLPPNYKPRETQDVLAINQ